MAETRSDVYVIPVEGIGDFEFRHRRIRDRITIPAEARRTLGGGSDSPPLIDAALRMATIQVLLLKAPDGWSLEALDPLDDASDGVILKVYEGLRQAEDAFRKGPAA